MDMMKQYRSRACGLFMSLLSIPAFGHHSFAMFDHDKQVTLVGTVKEFQWTNPHCWIQLLVASADGTPLEWGIELDSPRSLVRTGWGPQLVKVGDKITVVVYPKKDGTNAGGYHSGIAADGTALPPKGR
jgi:Family of unknown function (DUF6152)